MLRTPREKARATYALVFAKNVFELFCQTFFSPLSTPTFLCSWLNTAICIIVILFCSPGGLLSGKVNYGSFAKVHIYVQFSNQEESYIVYIEFTLHLETEDSKLTAPRARFNLLS